MEDNWSTEVLVYAVVVSNDGMVTHGLDNIKHLTTDLSDARGVAASDLGQWVDIYSIYRDHYEHLETVCENFMYTWETDSEGEE